MTYPSKYKFQTREEIETYFSGDRIQCLLCGKWYKSLSAHLYRTHEISARQYKHRFGLPFSRGLTSKPTRKLFVQAAEASYDAGIGVAQKAVVKKARKVHSDRAKLNPGQEYPMQPFRKRIILKKGERQTIYSDEHILSLGKRAKEAGMWIKDFCKLPEEPSQGNYHRRLAGLRKVERRKYVFRFKNSKN